MSIPIDPRFIPAFSIETVILDKDTGAPLSGGLVYFEQDNQRGILKPIYQITGTSPNYTFTQLPNPMVLSSIGTFEDSIGNPVIPYFFPFDVNGDVELYYVRVNSAAGGMQFDREAQPYVITENDSLLSGIITNEISNPQFAEVLFDTSSASYIYSFNAVTNAVVSIAPDWDLIVTSPGAGTLTVSQLKPAGSLNIITNPGTILEVSSAGLTRLDLRQRIYGSPNLWGSGYLATSIVAKTFTGTGTVLPMFYSQSNGTVIDLPILSANLPASGAYVQQSNSVLIPVSNSLQTFPDAYIDIYLSIPLGIRIGVTSIMVASTGDVSIDGIGYDEESLARQIDHLFHYYRPQLEYKPIPSYLVGWDFSLNPSQFFANGVAGLGSTGANKSSYMWDQTIGFQTVNNSVNFARNSASKALNITVTSATSFAIIQYLPLETAREVLDQANCMQLQALVDAGTLNGTISLWWTADTTLPDIKASNYNSLVSSITAGVPACANGTWVQVRNRYTDFGVTASNKSSIPFQLNTVNTPINFSGFDDDAGGFSAAQFMAIVIAFDTMQTSTTLTIEYCSLNGGDIPTAPAPQTPDEVLRECQYYYRKSFLTNVTPTENVGLGNGESYFVQTVAQNTANFGPIIRFDYPMIHMPSPTLYNPSNPPVGLSSNILNISVSGSYSASGISNTTALGFVIGGTSNTGSAEGNLIAVNWIADARLGTF